MNDSQNKRKNDTTSNENENTTSPKDNVDITVTGVAVYAPEKNNGSPSRKSNKKRRKSQAKTQEAVDLTLHSQTDNAIMDIMDDMNCKTKVAEKRKTSQSHFNFFLTIRNTKLLAEGKQAGKASHADITFEDVNTGTYIGEYANYLGQVARTHMNPKNELISCGSAAGYMSAIRTYFLDKFNSQGHNNGIPMQLQTELWKRKSSRVRSMKIMQAKINNKPVFGSKEAASDEDRTGIMALCIWSGNVVNAEFFNFFQSMVMNCGRGSEIGIARLDHLHMRHIIEETGIEYDTLEQYVIRSKTEGA